MKAFQNIRTEMRENCLDLTRLATRAASAARIARPAPAHDAEDGGERHPFIDPWMEIAFEGLTQASETGDPYVLVPCLMNGKPAAMIAALRPFGRKIHATPLFLACQPWMNFGPPPSEDGEEEDGRAGDSAAAADPPAPR